MKKPKGETTFIIGIVVVTLAILAGGIFLLSLPAKELSRTQILPETVVIKGQKDAPNYLVEFSDFQCPACRFYKPVVDSLVEKYQNKLVFGYRHFPLPQHTFALKAAEATLAANEEGKFWNMYDYLFENQSKLSDEFILESGKALGLNEQKFKNALDSGMYTELVEKDVFEGKRLRVTSTPTFFLNGRKLELDSPADLQKAVELELEK